MNPSINDNINHNDKVIFPCRKKKPIGSEIKELKIQDQKYKMMTKKATQAGDWYFDKAGMLCFWVRKNKDQTKSSEDDYQTSSYSQTYGGEYGLVKVHPIRYFWYRCELYVFAKRKGVEHLYECLDINSKYCYVGKYNCYDPTSLR